MKKLQNLLNLCFSARLPMFPFNEQRNIENSIPDKIKKHKMLA